MASFTHVCDRCGKQALVPERYLGRELRCTQCGQPFRAEAPQAPPAAPVLGAGGGGEVLQTTPEPAPAGGGADPGPVSPAPGPVQESFVVAVKVIDVLSMAKMSAAVNGVLGLIAGFLLGGLILLGSSLPMIPGRHVTGLAVAVVFGMPIGHAVMGFVGGAISAFVYNLVAAYLGGVRVTFE